MTPDFSPNIIDILNAAAVPHSVKVQSFGDWLIQKAPLHPSLVRGTNRGIYTLLRRKIKVKASLDNLHKIDDDGCILDVVMEDSPKELARHLPIWLNAHGRVLKTGLGLGCVVRGLLKNPAVRWIDVIEIDADIIRVIGKEFRNNPRVNIIHADALTYQPAAGTFWDFIWHDIWTPENEGLQAHHMNMIRSYDAFSGRQGAWQLPRWAKKLAAIKRYPILEARAA